MLVALVGVLALKGPAPRARPAAGADVATIAARVETLRDLRFRSRPVPQEVTPAQARRDGLAELDRSYSAAQRGADEEMLKLLGLIEPDVDLRAVSASVYEEGVAGYYDPRSKHLRIVKGTAPGALNEMVIAHELTHALEDQRFGLPSDQGGSDDRLLAALALGEGTAMVISQEYLQRHIGVEKALATLGVARSPERSRPARSSCRPSCCSRTPAGWRSSRRCASVPAARGSSSTSRSACACPTAPSRSCIRRSGSRSSRRCPSRWTSRSERAGVASRAGPSANGRPGNCSATPRRQRGGEATATSSGSAARARPRRPAARPTCW